MKAQVVPGPKAPLASNGGQGPSSLAPTFSAKPDGSCTVITSRPVRACDSDKVLCPRCGYRMRITVGLGDVLVTCERRVTPRQMCGQKVGILGLPGRVCMVFALSVDEFTDLQKTGAEAGNLFRRLALVDSNLNLHPAA